MASRGNDEDGVQSFVDENGDMCFLDEELNFTCGDASQAGAMKWKIRRHYYTPAGMFPPR